MGPRCFSAIGELDCTSDVFFTTKLTEGAEDTEDTEAQKWGIFEPLICANLRQFWEGESCITNARATRCF